MNLKLYIADDSELVTEKLINILSEIKQIKIVGKTFDALTAIRSLEKLEPDVVILDVHLRNGTGIDVLRNIRKEKPSTIVIVTTNQPETYRKVYLEAGADFFLDKSIEFEKILDICKILIHQRNNIKKAT